MNEKKVMKKKIRKEKKKICKKEETSMKTLTRKRIIKFNFRQCRMDYARSQAECLHSL